MNELSGRATDAPPPPPPPPDTESKAPIPDASPELLDVLANENQDGDLPRSGNGQQGEAVGALGSSGEQVGSAGEQLPTAGVESTSDNNAGISADKLDTTQSDDKSAATDLDKSELPPDKTQMSTDEALDAAQNYLGDGYTEPDSGSGRFVSADGTRVVRMGDSDIAGAHGPGPHVNFEKLAPNPLKPGKMMVMQNSHIILTDV